MPLPDFVAKVREFGDRPLRLENSRLVYGAVAVLILIGGLLMAFSPAQRSPSRARTSPPPTRVVVPPVATPPVASPSPAVHVSRRGLTAARRAARRFLSAYLPFTYGHGSARRIPAATHALRTSLLRPRVPPTVARLHPRVKHLEAESASATEATVVASVSDGERVYAVSVAMTRGAHGWRASGLRGD